MQEFCISYFCEMETYKIVFMHTLTCFSFFSFFCTDVCTEACTTQRECETSVKAGFGEEEIQVWDGMDIALFALWDDF